MEQNIQPDFNQPTNNKPILPHKSNLTKIIILVIGIIVVIGAIVFGGLLYWQEYKSSQIVNNNQNNQNNNYVPLQDSSGWTPDIKDIFVPPLPQPADGTYPVSNTLVQWSGNPVKIADLKLILGYRDNYNPSSTNQSTESIFYYELGMHGSNKIILVITPVVDMGDSGLFFFEKTPIDTYIFMQKMSSNSVYGYKWLRDGDSSNISDAKLGAGYVLSSKIKIADATTYYKDIVGPEDINYRGLVLRQYDFYPTSLLINYLEQERSNDITIKKVGTIQEGDVYLYQQASSITGTNIDSVHFYIRRYIIKLPSGLYSRYYTTYNFFSDNFVPNITWKDGTKNQDAFRADASLGGCGNPGGYIVPVNNISSSIKPMGITNIGQTIYEFKDINNPILKFFYTNQSEDISLQEWYSHHPVIVYKNAIGDNVIFTNEKYGIAAECGKPVIYLYPTKPTNVKVQVGADITKSEPLYNVGWQVQANSDGKLKTIDGNIFDSLFWEGIGHGNYPAITEGFIVPQAELQTTIMLQIKELGLNDKESVDFLDFWLSKMPDTPYIRLTWFTTAQLNELAPLVILPKPDTIIRIFLDFQGLQNKISLPIQHLTALPRKGFTVVEWGGLLKK